MGINTCSYPYPLSLSSCCKVVVVHCHCRGLRCSGLSEAGFHLTLYSVVVGFRSRKDQNGIILFSHTSCFFIGSPGWSGSTREKSNLEPFILLLWLNGRRCAYWGGLCGIVVNFYEQCARSERISIIAFLHYPSINLAN
jgi:hypothetical protein